MSLLELPWIVLVLIPFVFMLLALREVLILLSFPPHHPERKIAVFNAVILVTFCVGGVYGLRILRAQVEHLSALVEIYPSARFAPERELLSKKNEWVFVTKDQLSQIEQFYQRSASSTGAFLERDTRGGTERLLLHKGEKNMFITLQRVNDITLIFFSEEGEVRVVSTSTN